MLPEPAVTSRALSPRSAPAGPDEPTSSAADGGGPGTRHIAHGRPTWRPASGSDDGAFGMPKVTPRGTSASAFAATRYTGGLGRPAASLAEVKLSAGLRQPCR